MAITRGDSQLHGQVFEIGAGLVAEKFAVDSFYASGFSGLIGYSQNPVLPVDMTWDNFSVTVPAPATCLLAVVGMGLMRPSRSRRRDVERSTK